MKPGNRVLTHIRGKQFNGTVLTVHPENVLDIQIRHPDGTTQPIIGVKLCVTDKEKEMRGVLPYWYVEEKPKKK